MAWSPDRDLRGYPGRAAKSADERRRDVLLRRSELEVGHLGLDVDHHLGYRRGSTQAARLRLVRRSRPGTGGDPAGSWREVLRETPAGLDSQPSAALHSAIRRFVGAFEDRLRALELVERARPSRPDRWSIASSKTTAQRPAGCRSPAPGARGLRRRMAGREGGEEEGGAKSHGKGLTGPRGSPLQHPGRLRLGAGLCGEGGGLGVEGWETRTAVGVGAGTAERSGKGARVAVEVGVGVVGSGLVVLVSSPGRGRGRGRPAVAAIVRLLSPLNTATFSPTARSILNGDAW